MIYSKCKQTVLLFIFLLSGSFDICFSQNQTTIFKGDIIRVDSERKKTTIISNSDTIRVHGYYFTEAYYNHKYKTGLALGGNLNSLEEENTYAIIFNQNGEILETINLHEHSLGTSEDFYGTHFIITGQSPYFYVYDLKSKDLREVEHLGSGVSFFENYYTEIVTYEWPVNSDSVLSTNNVKITLDSLKNGLNQGKITPGDYVRQRREVVQRKKSLREEQFNVVLNDYRKEIQLFYFSMNGDFISVESYMLRPNTDPRTYSANDLKITKDHIGFIVTAGSESYVAYAERNTGEIKTYIKNVLDIHLLDDELYGRISTEEKNTLKKLSDHSKSIKIPNGYPLQFGYVKDNFLYIASKNGTFLKINLDTQKQVLLPLERDTVSLKAKYFE